MQHSQKSSLKAVMMNCAWRMRKSVTLSLLLCLLKSNKLPWSETSRGTKAGSVYMVQINILYVCTTGKKHEVECMYMM